MNFEETLKLIAAAQGKPDQLALATVEIVLAGQLAADRDALRAAMDAAAVPHWFDAALLAKLLDPSLAPRADELFARLCAFPFIERFTARGETAHNVHETTRKPWRARLVEEQPERFRELSRRMVAALPAPDDRRASSAERIESLYHRLVVPPTADAVTQCEALGREWQREGRTEERQALAGALCELEYADLLSGNARAVALMEMAEARWSFQPLDITAELVGEACKVAESAGDPRRLARAALLRGGVAQGRGNLASAMQAFDLCLNLRRECVQRCPGDAELENELADVHSYIGDVRQAQGDLAGARAAFEATQAMYQKLAAQDRANAAWQRELAVSHSRVGDVRLAQGDLAGARAAFEAYQAISQKLAAQDPANAAWQRDLAVSHGRIGHVAKAQRELDAALSAYLKDLEIFRNLSSQDPTNTGWEQNVATCQCFVGDVRLAQGDLAGARAAFEAYLGICQKLAAQDPANADWQRELAVSHSKVGDVRLAQGDLAGARAAFEAYQAISQKLAAQDPANADWQRDLAVSHWKLGDMAQRNRDFNSARRELEKALAIFERLTKLDPTNADWRQGTKRLRGWISQLPPIA